MEATALSVGKSVLDGALGYAKSAVAEEVALQLGIQRDHAFIRGELEMMQAFLRAAHDERDNHEVLMTWVKQVRDVAYDAEDCLQDFSIRLRKPSWWRLPSTLKERRRIAKQMKELRARVEDVSQRNLRYQLIKGSSSKPPTSFEQPNITATAIFGINDAQRAAKQDNSKVDLVHLIHQGGEDLRVIAVWGTSGHIGQASIINEAYENTDIGKKFPCRAWVRVLHPFNPNDFIQGLVKQFQLAEGVGILLEEEKTREELVGEFIRYVNQKSYLIVLNGLSTFEEWRGIRTCFPNNKKGSRIIVCTPEAEVASLCAGKESQVLELKQLSADQIIYAFYEKGCQDRTNSPMPILSLSTSNAATTSNINSVPATNEILENQSKYGNQRKVVAKSLTRMRTMTNALEECQLIGRKKETSHMVKMILDKFGQQFSVISVWGMGGLGKTTLVKGVYQNQNLIGIFEKRAFVTAMRPFNLKELLKSLIMQLSAEPSEKKSVANFLGATKNKLAMMGVEALREELAPLLRNKCLIVLDDLSSTTEWDMIIWSFPKMEKTSRIIVTTREENIAKHCSEKQEKMYMLQTLEYNDAFDLFTRKVFKETIDWDKHPELMIEAKSILKKCNGLPLAIVTIGGFLANQPKTSFEWKKLNEYISAELEINPELEDIRTILSKSYDGLPYHLKSCFLYMSIFSEDQKVSRRRLVQRWTAEGYSREIREKPADEIADRYFMELTGRSMILPCQDSVYSRNGIDSCQVHDLMREISITKSTEENLVLRLEEGCSLNMYGAVRHLSISRNWKGDKEEFEGTVDLSRIRSLTVFGEWRPFFMSAKMCFLRVLDLENTQDLWDHHLKEIGKLLHLKYLSLRGCTCICHLPDSLGNLKQLQTLDIKDTSIQKLPNTIINLRKLEHIYAGNKTSDDPNEDSDKLTLSEKIGIFMMIWIFFCWTGCTPETIDEDDTCCDVCTFYCYGFFSILMWQSVYGVALPRGFRKLRALRTLSTVNIAVGKQTLKDIKRLTQLRRLGVTGINKKNCQDFCSTLDDLSCLESLSVHSAADPGLHGCLDGVSSPPKDLQSLKLAGRLVKLPEWVEVLHNLVKLKLTETKLSELDATISVLGKLPNLAILCLLDNSFEGEDLHLTFHREAFSSLMVLRLDCIGDVRSVEFAQDATPKLEVLRFVAHPIDVSSRTFSGLASLPRLKEFVLDNDDYSEDFLKSVLDQLARNPNAIVLKRQRR